MVDKGAMGQAYVKFQCEIKSVWDETRSEKLVWSMSVIQYKPLTSTQYRKLPIGSCIPLEVQTRYTSERKLDKGNEL